ncbi:MAG TPA: hypothetical protein VF621_02150 [Pyrinomonadaceae bacterium]
MLMLLTLSAPVRAMWASVPLEQLVQESDLIVVGTLRGVTEHTAGDTDYGRGRIEVREVIWGAASPGDSLALEWQNASAVACPRVEHKGNEGREGIWLLTRDGEALNASHPGRFVGLSERRKIETALRRTPVVLRAESYRVKRGEPMRFSVIYRNASDRPRTFPGLAFEGGDIRVSPGTRLAVAVTFCDSEAYGVARLSGRVVRDHALAPVAVPPGEEHRAEVDLRAMLAAEPAEKYSYNVTFTFGGLPPTNELYFYVGEPPAPRPEPVINYSRLFKAPVARRGPAPLTRAGLAALAALLLSPIFYRLRAAHAGAGPARFIRGTQTWQI